MEQHHRGLRDGLGSRRISIEPKNGVYLAVNGTRIPIRNVVVLLEMPVYWIDITYFTGRYRTIKGIYWSDVEQMYWDVVAHPALALAIHLASPPDVNIQGLYREMVKKLTIKVVLTDVYHPGSTAPPCGTGTPFLMRKIGCGICGEQSMATSLFASNALGAYTSIIGLPDHAISTIMYSGRNSVDTDKDGRPDAMVLRDTADLPIDYRDIEEPAPCRGEVLLRRRVHGYQARSLQTTETKTRRLHVCEP